MPVVETVLAKAEQMIIELAILGRLDDVPGQSRQWQCERAMVLCSLGWQRPGAIILVQFLPFHAADFVTAGTSQNQQVNDFSEIIVFAGIPYPRPPRRREDAVPPPAGFRLVGGR